MLLTPQNHLTSFRPSSGATNLDEASRTLRKKYEFTSWFYDILDYPWERQYRRWRPSLLQDLAGKVLEAGVGTGRNLRHYPREVHVTGVDISPGMLSKASRRTKQSVCDVTLLHNDATRLSDVPACQFDWYIATFLYCVLPDELQPLALSEIVLKPGGRFRILEIVYSKDPRLARRQERLARWVEAVYGARFDRHTLQHLLQNDDVAISETRFLKADTYLLIEGYKRKLADEFSSDTGRTGVTSFP
ncbi:MAG: class I SAM-dependent methyltransferase [Planctomycetia bacterium]|nr:class I SAM-dependent methyltransferase [Planctomycetia bacterium]